MPELDAKCKKMVSKIMKACARDKARAPLGGPPPGPGGVVGGAPPATRLLTLPPQSSDIQA